MNSIQDNTEDLLENVVRRMEGVRIFGKHIEIIDEYYGSQGKDISEDLDQKLKYIISDYGSFDDFLRKNKHYQYKSYRLDAKRQAQIEPVRMKEAKIALEELGFEVTVVGHTELNFRFNGSLIKYYPYSQWASGKTIVDGRGLKKLLDQLKPAP